MTNLISGIIFGEKNLLLPKKYVNASPGKYFHQRQSNNERAHCMFLWMNEETGSGIIIWNYAYLGLFILYSNKQ